MRASHFWSVAAGGPLPPGWELRTETERIEVTRDGSLPPYEMDMVRRWIPGRTTAWLTTPDGRCLPLPVPFTMADVEALIVER